MEFLTRNEGHAVIMIVLHSTQQLNDNGFFCYHPMTIRGAGLQSLARGNYPQSILGDLLVWDLVVLFVRAFNTESSSDAVRSKKASDREISFVVLHVND